MRILLATSSLILPQDRKYFALALYLLKGAIEAADDLADCQVDIVDRSILEDDYDAVVLSREYDVVGLSCQCWNLDHHVDLAAEIKRRYPNTLTVLGGHSAYYEKERLLASHPSIDVVVNGEGEQAIVEILRARKEGRPLEGIAGVCTRAGGISGMPAAVRCPPMPFTQPGTPLSEYYLMETMRGCVFKCDYCTWWVGQRNVRYYPEEFLEANLRHALASGYKKAWIIDAAINFANGPLERLAGCVRRTDPERSLKFWYFVQWTTFQESQMPSFEALGVDTIHIGLESANPDVLAAAGRNWDETKVRNCVQSLSKIATPVVDIILGLPGDTPDGFRRTLDFVESLGVNVLAFRLMLYPGSEHHRRQKELGLVTRDGLMPFVAQTPSFPREQLDGLTELVKSRAYFDPASKRYFLYEPPDYWERGQPVVREFRK